MIDKIEYHKKDIIKKHNESDRIRVDIVDENTQLTQIEYLNKLELDKINLMYVELTKKVFL